MDSREVEAKLQGLDGENLSPFSFLQEMLMDFLYTGIEDIANKYTNEQLFAFILSINDGIFSDYPINLEDYKQLLKAYSEGSNLSLEDLSTESSLKHQYIMMESLNFGDICHSVLCTLNYVTSRGGIGRFNRTFTNNNLYNDDMGYQYSSLCKLISQVPAKSNDSGLVLF